MAVRTLTTERIAFAATVSRDGQPGRCAAITPAATIEPHTNRRNVTWKIG